RAFCTRALMSTGLVKCWGDNSFRELGDGTTNSTAGPSASVVSLGVPNPTVTAISAGNSHTCALLSGGTVKCWGKNSLGELGNADTSNNLGDAPEETGKGLPVVALPRPTKAISAGDDSPAL